MPGASSLIVPADSAEKALFLWAAWSGTKIDAVLKKPQTCPEVSEVIGKRTLLDRARTLRKELPDP